MRQRRALNQASAFAQSLLACCHRDVVLLAQDAAKSTAKSPSACQRERLPGEQPLTLDHARELQTKASRATLLPPCDRKAAACRRHCPVLRNRAPTAPRLMSALPDRTSLSSTTPYHHLSSNGLCSWARITAGWFLPRLLLCHRSAAAAL